MKQDIFIISQFPWSGVQHRLAGSSERLQSRCQLRLQSHLSVDWLTQVDIIQFITAVRLRALVSCWLLDEDCL